MAEKPPLHKSLSSGHTYHILVYYIGSMFVTAVQIGWGGKVGFGDVCCSCVCFAAGALLGWVAMPNASVPNLTSKQG